jgi:hypothetical protein
MQSLLVAAVAELPLQQVAAVVVVRVAILLVGLGQQIL